MKTRTTISVNTELWDKFIAKIFEEYKKTHGGVLSKTIEKLIEKYVTNEEG